MSSDTVLIIVALVWAVLVALVLMAMGVIPAGAAPIPGGNDDMTCGVWTYYAPGLAEIVRQNREIPACSDCIGLAVTVDHHHLGQQISIRHAGQWVGPFLVVDVGTGRHRPQLVGEVDYSTAMTWRITGPWWTCFKAEAS